MRERERETEDSDKNVVIPVVVVASRRLLRVFARSRVFATGYVVAREALALVGLFEPAALCDLLSRFEYTWKSEISSKSRNPIASVKVSCRAARELSAVS